jgi:CrcB protein
VNPAVTTLWIGLAGAMGTIARYWIAKWALPISQVLPRGTIGISFAGSFVIGFVGAMTLMQGRYPLPETARLFIMVGFCGGFTTSSSFSLQTLDLLRSIAWTRAPLNIAVSVLFCLLAVAAGHALASMINGGAQKIAQTVTEEEVG